MSAIHTGSGSIYPGKELLDHQLESSGKKKVTLSSARWGDLPIWDKTFVDLTRLGTLQANGETIYSNGISEEIGDAAEKTKFVFDSLAEKLDSTSLAHKAIDLFEQDLGGDVLSKVTQQKGFSRYNAELDTIVSTHSVVAKRQFNAITTKGSDFQVIHEELVQVRPMDNPERVSYFKVKTMVKGKTKALEGRDTTDMSVSAAYTKEYATMKEALGATYWGTKAGGLKNTKSYISEASIRSEKKPPGASQTKNGVVFWEEKTTASTRASSKSSSSFQFSVWAFLNKFLIAIGFRSK